MCKEKELKILEKELDEQEMLKKMVTDLKIMRLQFLTMITTPRNPKTETPRSYDKKIRDYKNRLNGKLKQLELILKTEELTR